MKGFEFRKGRVVTFTFAPDGEMDVLGVFKVLRDFDAQDTLHVFSAITQCDLTHGHAECERYVNWLLDGGFVTPLQSTALDLGWEHGVELSQTTPKWGAYTPRKSPVNL